ncbi:MAG: phage antirepressor N-terminal domain-containing protein [Brumimicrobium sp.]|nr:phage antirepressor N-terminal domain-containing protein [Brumimicrobium sp.]
MTHTKFLQFNGRTIWFTNKDGENWIAIKPICEALGVNYVGQYKKLTEDKFYTDALYKTTMRDSKNRKQEMVCISEKSVYGWIASINSPNEEFWQYKRTCYDILYQHFKGVITGRRELLEEKITIRDEMQLLKEELQDNEKYQRLVSLEKEDKEANKRLKNLDKELIQQPKLF